MNDSRASHRTTRRGPSPKAGHRVAVRVLLAGLLAQGLMLVGLPGVASSAEPLVQTTTGPVVGIVTESSLQWRGLPYAAPPVGGLRWRPPHPASSWSTPRDASQFRNWCAQPNLETGELNGSEDCLYLNVSAPLGTTSQDRRPVMVHLHGGSNTFGGPVEDTSAFTDRGVMVVTVAYRLGVFGFVGHPALSAEAGGSSGEYGVLDQIAALRWVRDNIAAFGGDPANVTLFGLSAGSFDTVALMASPLSQGLMARAAVQGEVWWALNGKFNAITDAEQLGVGVAERVGCATALDQASCLRQVPAQELAASGGFIDAAPWVGGTVLPQAPDKLLQQSNVPLLVGFDREENSIFVGPEPEQYPRHAWVKDTNSVLGPAYGAQARKLYPPEKYGSMWWSYITLLTDGVRGCPTRTLANIVAGGSPVWRFLYSHTFADPLLEPFRAAHTFEDLLLWHNTNFFELTPAEQVLANQITDYWVNFAKTGNPNGPGLPTWPQYETANEPILVLDTPVGLSQEYHKTECAFVDSAPILFPYPWEGGGHPPDLPLFPPGFS